MENETEKIKDPRDLSSYLKLTPDGEVRLLDETPNVAISIMIRILATMPKSQQRGVIDAVSFVYK
jgi:hypothetical protein